MVTVAEHILTIANTTYSAAQDALVDPVSHRNIRVQAVLCLIQKAGKCDGMRDAADP